MAVILKCQSVFRVVQTCWKSCIIQTSPDALLLVHSIYGIESCSNLHPNLTLTLLSEAHRAFIAPRFLISQLFQSTPNAKGLSPRSHC